MIEFNSLNLISDSTPIIDLISILRDTPAIFVLVRNKVKNIVTRADLQKPPVRMLIFGYINILEMNLLQTINYFYKEDTWTDYISQNRLEKARTLYQERKARNEDITLSDCLQLCDKTRLILQNEKLLQFYGIESKNKGEKLFKKIEMLRNKLAHSQDIVIGSSWEEIFDIVKNIETLLDKSSKSANKTDIKSLSVNSKEMYYKRARE